VKVGDTREFVADWFRIVVFGRDAEVISQYAKKGSALAFNGRLQNEKWIDREGLERTSTVLIASSFEFLQSRKKEEPADIETTALKPDFLGDEEEVDEEVPF
jgi:single stranded DNA-binding protein